MWTKRRAMAEAQNAIESYRQQAEQFHREAWEINQDITNFDEEYCELRTQLAEGLLGSEITEGGLAMESAKWSCPQLLEHFRDLRQLRQSKITERNELINHPTVVGRIALLESAEASLPAAFKVAEESFLKAQTAKDAFHSKAFDWLYEKKVHEAKEPAGFSKFWKIVTLETRKTNRYLDEVKSKHHRVYRDVVHGFEEAVAELAKHQLVFDEDKKQWDDAIVLVGHFDALNAWDHNFEGTVLTELGQVLAEHLHSFKFEDLIMAVPDRLRHLVAGMHALTKKIDYAQSLIEYLNEEERDRQHRINSISGVHNKWRRNPSGYVRGDKSKWLQDIPHMKHLGTNKRIGWSRSMRSNLCGYSDYSYYGNHYHHSCMHGSAFLAFDLFNHRPEFRMPYEGFSSSVISEIGDFRESDSDSGWIGEVQDDEFYDEEEFYEEELSEAEEAELEAAAAMAESMEEEGFEGEDDVS